MEMLYKSFIYLVEFAIYLFIIILDFLIRIYIYTFNKNIHTTPIGVYILVDKYIYISVTWLIKFAIGYIYISLHMLFKHMNSFSK